MKVISTPIKAIRAIVVATNIQKLNDCPLWYYRFGKRPKDVITVSRIKI